MKTKIIDEIVDMVIEGLENGTVPWRKTWKTCLPMNAFSKRPYNGFNTFLLSYISEKCKYSHPLFGTFLQISEAGGRVKKGQKSFPVIYWKITEKDEKSEETGEKQTKKRFTPFYSNVFNIDQTEGIDIENYVSDFLPQDNHPLEMCETVINQMPNPPRIVHEQNSAFYRPSEDKVNIPELCYFEGSEEYYATTFHELAHSTGHSSRLNRFEDNRTFYGGHSYDYEELVAEMAATFLCSHCGIEQTVENSVAYLTGWAKFLKEERKTTLFGAATKAQMAAGYILGKSVENRQSECVNDNKEIDFI
jgi:antirestriction protein ArdC